MSGATRRSWFLRVLVQLRIAMANHFMDHKRGTEFFFCASSTLPFERHRIRFRTPVTSLFPGPLDGRLMALARRISGNFTIQQDRVVFSTKKGAKRAVAFAVLEAHKATGVDAGNLIVPAIESDASTADETFTPRKGSKHRHRNFSGLAT
jgi:hypothetical protein